MVDPVTTKPTPYAYPGDPVTGTGWVDDAQSDIRNLIGSGPFSIPAGETETVIGVWIYSEGSNLSRAIGLNRGKLIEARREAHRIVQ